MRPEVLQELATQIPEPRRRDGVAGQPRRDLLEARVGEAQEGGGLSGIHEAVDRRQAAADALRCALDALERGEEIEIGYAQGDKNRMRRDQYFVERGVS